MRCSISLDNMNSTIPPIDKDQKVALLHVPLKGTTLFGGDLAKLQKANTESASALTVFPTPAVPPVLLYSMTLCGSCKNYNYNPGRRGGLFAIDGRGKGSG